MNAGNGTRLSIDFVSGNEADYNNNNYRGIIRIKTNAVPSSNKQNNAEGFFYEYPLKEFTNNKTVVHVAVKIKSGLVSIFINNKQVAVSTDFKMTYGNKCSTCGLEAGTIFNLIQWKNITNDTENVKMYIRNIKSVMD